LAPGFFDQTTCFARPSSGRTDKDSDMTFAAKVSPAGSTVGKSFDWAGLGWAYLFFWYFSGVHHLFLQLTGTTQFFGFRQAAAMSLLWLIPILLFPHKTRAISATLGIILWAFSLVSLGYFCIYQQEFSQSVIFIMFESNPNEASEYFAQYFVWWMIPGALAYSALAYFLWRRLRPLAMPRSLAWGLSLFILVLLFVWPVKGTLFDAQTPIDVSLEKIRNRMEPAVPWQIIVGYLHYREQLANMQDLLDQNGKIPPLKNLTDSHAGQPSTLVLVIGESTNRQHMSLYGYGRPTTPRLDALRPELTVFNQVVSPRPYTIEVLQQVLTFADQENPDLYLTQPSLMNLMKQAGYKTYWITNQQTMTKRNTMLTNFARQTDEQIYLNNSRAQNSREYDGNVFEPFQRILKAPEERKLIIVHLLGTHIKYEYRYPPEYERFTDRNGAGAWLDSSQLPAVNTYDNAVLYNDFVVSSLIGSLAESRAKGMLLYFADHGEDVFDSPGHKVLGRNEGKPTLPMYTVPFLLWQSAQWRAAHPLDVKGKLDRPYSMSHFIHTWSDLVGLRYDGFDSSKSLVSKDFKEHPLLVGNPAAPKSLIDLRSLMPAK
jgi:heptose-I-phosphate ethanolaminephosphotransferase